MSTGNATPRASKKHFHVNQRITRAGAYTFCGCFIPWKTTTGKRALTFAHATEGRTECPDCAALLAMQVDVYPLECDALLDEVDAILGGGVHV